MRVPARLRRVIAKIQVVHDEHVHARQPEPLQAVLEGALDAVGGVVEDDLERTAASPTRARRMRPTFVETTNSERGCSRSSRPTRSSLRPRPYHGAVS